MYGKLITAVGFGLVSVLAIPERVNASVVVEVDARSNIFESGDAVAYRGVLPVEIQVPSIAQYVEFSATGQAKAGPGWPWVGPDGGTSGPAGCEGTNVFSFDGISGLLHDRFLCLAGAFLTDDSPATGSEPERLNFINIGSDFTQLSPLIAQSFFIGDGFTGTGEGESQRFIIPNGATRLFLGFVDSNVFGWPDGNEPFAYADNTGALMAEVSFEPQPVPEPASLVRWSGLGVMGLVAARRRKRAG